VYDAAVIGGGVVGAAVTLALARRGADTILLESTGALAVAASGTN
jgi:glycine/D-amino acid oxidase-like deaminating enzyme